MQSMHLVKIISPFFLCITLACAILKVVKYQNIFSISSHLQNRNQFKSCFVTFFVVLQHKLIYSFIKYIEEITSEFLPPLKKQAGISEGTITK